MATKKEVIEVLKFLADQYNYEPTEAAIDGYCMVLGEYPKEHLMKAAVSHIKKERWFPKINQLVAELRSVPYDNPPTHNPYWAAMSAFASRLRGVISDTDFEGTAESKFIERTKANDIQSEE